MQSLVVEKLSSLIRQKVHGGERFLNTTSMLDEDSSETRQLLNRDFLKALLKHISYGSAEEYNISEQTLTIEISKEKQYYDLVMFEMYQ